LRESRGTGEGSLGRFEGFAAAEVRVDELYWDHVTYGERYRLRVGGAHELVKPRSEVMSRLPSHYGVHEAEHLGAR
jgi:hypothetical protein